ncbi:MAG: radical SAM/SPASM domain protein, ACGX system [Acholeplasmatales bacterium]|nr:radical SAM/SPASM domain protein, ACGX system [Acholeplasmatales bacterium]
MLHTYSYILIMENYFAIQWHITDYCDQRCKHCYIFSEGHNKLITTEIENMIHITDEIIDFCKRINRKPYIYLTGGDPILHPNFWDLLEYFKLNDIRFCIMGNPFHLKLDVCKRMKNLGCVKYQLSLDGLENTHDMFRKPGSFNKTLEAIKIIKESGMWVAVMSTVSKTNYKEIPELIDLVDKLGVDVYAVGRYCPTSIEKAYDSNIHMTPLEYKGYMDLCFEKYMNHKDSKTTYQLKDHLWTLYLFEKGLFKPNTLPLAKNQIIDGCNLGRNHITILPNGDVYACRRMESKVGNIYNKSLSDLWKSNEMDNYRQYDKFVKCNKCKLKAFCRGCPSVTYGYTHNMYDGDPQCWMEV